MPITTHLQPLTHEIAHHYEVNMERRLAAHLQHVDEIQQQRFNELQTLIRALHKDEPCHSTPIGDNANSPDVSLTSPPIPPIPSIPPIPPIPSIPSTPLPPSLPPPPRLPHNPPSIKLTCLKASELPKFYGCDDDDIIDWVQKISSIKRGSKATNDDILCLLPLILCGHTTNYYFCLSEMEHETLTTWDSWAKELQDRFLPPNCLDDLKDKCINQYLGHNEKFSNYYEDKTYLQQFLYPAHTEDSMLI